MRERERGSSVSFEFCITDVAIWAGVGNKGLKIVILGSLTVISWTPIPSFLWKHPLVAKGKIRDTVIETKTKCVGRKIRK